MRTRRREEENERPPNVQLKKRETAEPKGRDDGPEQDRRGPRVGKIQYRFLKEIEEEGLDDKKRQGAHQMIDRIKQYPLDDVRVMRSWERFTSRAIEDFKAGRGNNADRDGEHRSYAIVFQSLRNRKPASSIDELKARVDSLGPKNSPKGSPRDIPRQTEKPAERSARGPGTERAPDQRPSPEAKGDERPDPMRAVLDGKVDAALARLQNVPFEHRHAVETNARDMLMEGKHTARSAEAAFLVAVTDLRASPSSEKAILAFSLAAVARTKEHGELVAMAARTTVGDQREIVQAARLRLDGYPADGGHEALRKDQTDAAVRHAVAPSDKTLKEALILAHARDELELRYDPKRLSLDLVARDLAFELG